MDLDLNNNNSGPILIYIAMEAEAMPIVEKLSLFETNKFEFLPSTVRCYADKSQDQIILITSGVDLKYEVDNVSTQAAAAIIGTTLSHIKPRLVINAGTAGGFKVRGAQIGEIYMAEKLYMHDRRIPLGAFQQYGEGHYLGYTVDGLHIKKGVVSTGNSLDTTPTDLEIMNKFGTHVKDMEAAAIAQVCLMWGNVPAIYIKGVTDLVDGAEVTADEFLSNLRKTSDNVAEAVNELIKLLTR
jgi:5'-methylthioadenosine nucleosidase